MRLILDAHIPSAVAKALRTAGIDIETLDGWRAGAQRHADDGLILEAALADNRVLVTYDCRTISPLVTEWAMAGRHHGGVALVDERTIHPSDVGGLIRAIEAMVREDGGESWQDRVIYLRPA